jgi:hypothetical protein
MQACSATALSVWRVCLGTRATRACAAFASSRGFSELLQTTAVKRSMKSKLSALQVEKLNVVGVSPGKGSTIGVLMDGAGSPTGHTFQNLRVFFFGTGAVPAFLLLALL